MCCVLQARIDELEEELDNERSNRAKVEKQRNMLQRELDDLVERLDEAGGATQQQTEIFKKREAELQRMKAQLEDQAHASEQAISEMKKKSQDAINEMQDQVEQMAKHRSKYDTRHCDIIVFKYVFMFSFPPPGLRRTATHSSRSWMTCRASWIT